MIDHSHHPMVSMFWNYFPFNYIFLPVAWIPNLLLLPVTIINFPFAAVWNFIPEVSIAFVLGNIMIVIFVVLLALFIMWNMTPVGITLTLCAVILLFGWPIYLPVTLYFAIEEAFKNIS